MSSDNVYSFFSYQHLHCKVHETIYILFGVELSGDRLIVAESKISQNDYYTKIVI